MAADNQAWLDLVKEEAIEPGLPICDPHHHLWDHPGQHYFLDEFLKDAGGGHNIARTVFVECGSMYRKDGPVEMQPVGEVEFVQGIAAQSASGLYGPTRVAAGIVGFADLMLGKKVAPVLDALVAASPNRFRGIRYSCAWDASPLMNPSSRPRRCVEGTLRDPTFREGIDCLDRKGLVFDAWVYHPQLMEVVDLAKAFPRLSIVLEHIGGPLGIGSYAGKRQEVLQVWKSGMAALAACPNVTVKLGAFGMPRLGFGWHERPRPPTSAELAEAMTPYVSWCVEQFGAERCMFESNFPPDKVSFSYTVFWNACKRACKGYSARERAALLHDTAAKVYKLPGR